MIKSNLVSIIIRTKNEERWISRCLEAVYSQDYKNIEVVLVDNMSSDKTVSLATKYPVKLISIEGFTPGKAINDGIRHSSGSIIVILSGHCIPVDSHWLENLIKPLEDTRIAGVYGRQEPMTSTTAIDKRDLLISFGLDSKRQIKDSFFHNANSSLLKSTWLKFPFDEKVTNIEDRIWGKKVIDSNLMIFYQPTASVFHQHGIHHNGNIERAERIVKILDSLSLNTTDNLTKKNISDGVAAIIPIRGTSLDLNGKTLLSYTLQAIKKSKYISNIYVATDNLEVANMAKSLGAKVPFIRPKYLSKNDVSISEVLSYCLEEIEKEDYHNLIVVFEETHPFRSISNIDTMVEEVINKGLDTAVMVYDEKRLVWTSINHEIVQSGKDLLKPRILKKDSSLINLTGIGCVTFAENIRNGNIYGNNVGLYLVNNPLSSIEIRDIRTFKQCYELLEGWNYE